jgi:branched-subunit amino acid transport protein
MGFIPYAALGALIFPGALTSASTGLEPAIAGLLLAIVMAWLEFNLILVVLGGIAGSFLMNITLM